MKRFLFAAVFLFLCAGGIASAENSEITFFAGGFLGDSFVYRPPLLLSGDLNATIGDHVLGGFRIAYFLTNHISVEGGFAFTPSSILANVNVGGGTTAAAFVDINTYVFNANAVAHLVNGPVIPFLTGGVAAVHFDFQTPNLPGVFLIPSETNAAFNAGGGVKIPFRNNTAFRFDGRYYWIDPQFTDDNPRFVELSGGVAILFNF